MYRFSPPLRILTIEWLCRGVILVVFILQVISVVSFYMIQIFLALVLVSVNIKSKGGYYKQLSGMLYGLNLTFPKTSLWWIIPLAGMVFSVGYVTFWTTTNAPTSFKYFFAVFMSICYCIYLAALCLESRTILVEMGKEKQYLPPYEELLTTQQKFFLKTFSSARKKQDLPFCSYLEWKDLLGETPERVTARLIKLGLVMQTPLSSLLDKKLTVDALKEILSAQGISTSGKKDVLITRLITNNPVQAKKLCPQELFECSPMGTRVLNEYLVKLQILQDLGIDQEAEIMRLEKTKFRELVVWMLTTSIEGIIANRADEFVVQAVQNVADSTDLDQDIDDLNQTSDHNNLDIPPKAVDDIDLRGPSSMDF